MKGFTKSWMMVIVLLVTVSMIAVGCGGNNNNAPANNGGSQGSETPSTGGDSTQVKEVDLTVATNNTQTSWYMFTNSLAEVMKNSEPVKVNNMEILPFSGGTGNADLIQNKEADFGLLFNITSKWAYDGIVAYDKKYEDLRGLVGGLNQYYIGIIASNDFLEKHNVTSLADIKEREIPVRVITNPIGSLAEYNTRLTLEAYGMDYDTVKSYGGSVELVSNDVIKSAFQNGTADLHVLAMTKAHPVITELALQSDITVMSMEPEIQEWFNQFGYKDISFPGGQFKGNDQEAATAGFAATYSTHKDMDEDVAYAITKAVVENKDALVQGHKSVSDFDPQQAADPNLLGVPLHPGAEKYYKEAGILK